MAFRKAELVAVGFAKGPVRFLIFSACSLLP